MEGQMEGWMDGLTDGEREMVPPFGLPMNWCIFGSMGG